MVRQKRLRKQPKLRRMTVSGAAALPRISVPKAAKKRRRRNKRQFSLPLKAIKRLVLSSRWISLFLLVVTIWALFVIGQEQRFYLNQIPVSGNISISTSDIIANSELANAHIFGANPSKAAARIGEMPGVISATVALEWPNRVSIRIVEDSPVALWEQDGDRFWVNVSGLLIPARSQSASLLLIQSEVEEDVGALTFIPEDVLEGALQLRELRNNIDRLFYSPGGGLSYQDGRGWRAYFGSGLDMEQKLVVYETIVDNLQARGVTPSYISVRNQEKPFYMAN
jgi:cell division septal protein FtsQ